MSKSKGFGIVAVITVVAVIVVVALIAWRISTNSDTNKNSQNPAATGNQGDNSPSQEGPTTQPAAKYLELKELGVKIQLDDKTADTTYIHDKPAGGQADGVWIIDPAMKSLDNANVYCAGATAGKIGRIDKSADPHYWSEAAIVVDNKTAFKLGEFYYVFRPLQAECSQDTGIAQQRTTRAENFKAVLSTIQAN